MASSLASQWRREFRHRSLRHPFDETRRPQWREELCGALVSVLGLADRGGAQAEGEPEALWEATRGAVTVRALRWPRAAGGAGECLWFARAQGSAPGALVIGLPDGRAGKAEWAGWQATPAGLDLAWSLAEVGYLVCVPDLAGNGSEAPEWEELARWGALIGRPLVGLQVADCLAWLEYALQRAEVDPERVAVMGFGNGALVGLLAAALDERLRRAVLSGFFGTWETVLTSPLTLDSWCLPALVHLAEITDLVQLLAPRPLFIEIGKHDPLCPPPAARQAWLKVKYGYEVAGAGGAVDWEVFEGGHRFWGRGALVWLRRHLKTWGRPRRSSDPDPQGGAANGA